MDLIALILSGFLFLIGIMVALGARDLVLLSRRNRLSLARMMAGTIVAFLEQASAWDDTLLEGAARKERAMLLLTQWALRNNVKLTFVEMDWLIEEAVLSLPYEIEPPNSSVWTIVGRPADYGVDYGNETIRTS